MTKIKIDIPPHNVEEDDFEKMMKLIKKYILNEYEIQKILDGPPPPPPKLKRESIQNIDYVLRGSYYLTYENNSFLIENLVEECSVPCTSHCNALDPKIRIHTLNNRDGSIDTNVLSIDTRYSNMYTVLNEIVDSQNNYDNSDHVYFTSGINSITYKILINADKNAVITALNQDLTICKAIPIVSTHRDNIITILEILNLANI